jgi:hypothetical protein
MHPTASAVADATGHHKLRKLYSSPLGDARHLFHLDVRDSVCMSCEVIHYQLAEHLMSSSGCMHAMSTVVWGSYSVLTD